MNTTTPQTTNPPLTPLYETGLFGSFRKPRDVSDHLGLSFYFESWEEVDEYRYEKMIFNYEFGLDKLDRGWYPTKNWVEYSDSDDDDDEWEEPPSKKSRKGILKKTYVPPPLCSLQLLGEKYDKKFKNLKWVDKIEKEFYY